MVTFDADVRRPSASTVICGTCVVVPYMPAATVVEASSLAPTTPDLMSSTKVLRSPEASMSDDTASLAAEIFAAVIRVVADALIAVEICSPALVAINGFGYVPVKSPPAAPPGVTPVIVVFTTLVIRPSASTENCGTCIDVPYTPGDTVVELSSTAPTVLARICRFITSIVPPTVMSDAPVVEGSIGSEAALVTRPFASTVRRDTEVGLP